MEGFEEFDQYHSRSVKTLFVTIQRRGNFSLNRAAYKALDEPEAVKMLFNRSKRLIAFRKADSNVSRSTPVRRQHQSESFLIAGLTFCKEYDIDTTTARRYVGKMQDGLLIVDLNEPSTNATGPRAHDDESGVLQGKHERRIARRIAERALISNDEEHIHESIATKENQEAAITQGAKGTLSPEKRLALENALKKGELSEQDILNLIGKVNNVQA